MQQEELRGMARRVVAAVAATLMLATGTQAGSNFRVLYSFQGGSDGAGPHAGLVRDTQGNLYGTTGGGGAYSSGTVFRLTRQPDGTWKEEVLHSFNFYADGAYPGAALVFDTAGNLYGTTSSGGAHGAGGVFELSPGPGGWTEATLYDFCAQPDCDDGGGPRAPLLLDDVGNLYGTAWGGAGVGVVFELTPGPGGWSESVLHDFCTDPDCLDGADPLGGLVWDEKGNLYGTTTVGGGPGGKGTVFKLKHISDATWKARVLHHFPAFVKDGQVPVGGVVFDGLGNLYGTTWQGGSHACGEVHCGTIFRLAPQPDGRWKETILHNFAPGRNGNVPSSGLVMDRAGNLYGTTGLGGSEACSGGCGVIYRLTPNPDGSWTYAVVHRFDGLNGFVPVGDLVLNRKGQLFGTTQLGGLQNYGVVYKLTP